MAASSLLFQRPQLSLIPTKVTSTSQIPLSSQQLGEKDCQVIQVGLCSLICIYTRLLQPAHFELKPDIWASCPALKCFYEVWTKEFQTAPFFSQGHHLTPIVNLCSNNVIYFPIRTCLLCWNNLSSRQLPRPVSCHSLFLSSSVVLSAFSLNA